MMSSRKYNPIKKHSFGIALICNDEVLIVQEKMGKLGFPKGHYENYDKYILSCAFRELYEETGININDYHFRLGKWYKSHNVSIR